MTRSTGIPSRPLEERIVGAVLAAGDISDTTGHQIVDRVLAAGVTARDFTSPALADLWQLVVGERAAGRPVDSRHLAVAL